MNNYLYTRDSQPMGENRLYFLISIFCISFLLSTSALADAPPPECEDPCSAGCPLYGHVCCTLPGSECCPTGAQGEVDCNNNNILDPCELANCIGADCDGNNVPDDCDIEQSQTLNCEYERYYYDALGRRIGKKAVNRCDRTESETHLYYYDAQNVILETLRNSDGSETAERYFVHGNQYIDERVVMHNLASSPAEDEEYYYLEKELHSIAGLVDKTGMIVESYSYDAYGKVRIWDIVRSYGDELSKSSCGNPYFFTGRRLDYVDDTGVPTPKQLYYYRTRYFCPDHGRFLGRDSLKYADSANLYEYVLSSPVVLFDPSGRYGEEQHHDDTVDDAMEAGLDKDDAEEVGRCDQDVDRPSNAAPLNGGLCLLTLGFAGCDAYDDHFPGAGPPRWFGPQDEVISGPGNPSVGRRLGGANKSCNLCELGAALHTLQDSYSHAGVPDHGGHEKGRIYPDGGPGKPGPGSIPVLPGLEGGSGVSGGIWDGGVDDPRNDVERYKKAREATKKAIREFLEKCRCKM